MRVPRLGQEAAFVACCFAAASAIPFLPPEAQAAFGAHGLGAPPLLMLAAATVAGTASLVVLRQGGFFGEGPAGSGFGAALRLATALALPVVLVDLARPFPASAAVPWPAAWLFYPAIAVVAAAALNLVPLALIHLATGRPALAIGAALLAEPAVHWAFGGALPGWQRVFVAVQAAAFGLVGLSLLRRHGVLALLAFRVVYAVHWHILWGEARRHIPLFAG